MKVFTPDTKATRLLTELDYVRLAELARCCVPYAVPLRTQSNQHVSVLAFARAA